MEKLAKMLLLFVILILSSTSLLAQEQIDWSKQAKQLRGQNGLRVDYFCPPGAPAGRVWGTGLYTDDSSICSAAVHAGLIRPDSGGSVTIEISPGAASYQGSSRYGVTSNNYGGWHGSFRFVSSSHRGQGRNHQQQNYVPPNPVDRGQGFGPPPPDAGRHPGRQNMHGKQITWATQADSMRGRNGSQAAYYCPSGGSYSGRLWGSGTYTDDSSICLAAVHAGVIRPESGGPVTIEIRPGAPSYQGSTRNGVTSNGYGGWHGSFVIVR